jgi:type I restriction enzyme S subunit
MAVFRSRKNHFVSHQFQSQFVKKQINAHLGATINQITNRSLNSFRIPVPTSTDEQKAIAKALSDVDALIDSLESLLTKKRNIKTGVMHELLTGHTRLPGFSDDWQTRRIASFTSCTSGGTPSTHVAEYWGGQIRWMSSGELNLKRVREVDGRITEAGLHNSSTKMVPAKCVLIGLAGQGKTRGTAAMNFVELCTNQSIAAIYPSKSHDSAFLYYVLDTKYEELRGLSDGGGGRGGLNLSIIKAIQVTLPGINEQKAIAAVLSDMDDEIEALHKRLAKTRDLKQGMAQELLTGRTRLV